MSKTRALSRCPYCHDHCTQLDSLAVCQSCLAPHHEACWDENGACATCQGQESLRAGDNQQPVRLLSGLAAVPTTVMALGFGIGALAVLADSYEFPSPQSCYAIVILGLVPALMFGALSAFLWSSARFGLGAAFVKVRERFHALIGWSFMVGWLGLPTGVMAVSFPGDGDREVMLATLATWAIEMVLLAIPYVFIRATPARPKTRGRKRNLSRIRKAAGEKAAVRRQRSATVSTL